jgi:hypothetical protein
VGDHPNDNEAYVGIARDQCGENEATLIVGENGYRWEREEGLICRYSSGKARFDNIGASGSGGPPGKRNGQYRHGERTKAAIAERQKFGALLKMLRAGLV